ncbi:MAG: glutathione S-transferase family protein, partial [Deltaproteobacteria bacterium]|nr:glutathione S-transferase family protein [Deltaproteobacteria bacterium]
MNSNGRIPVLEISEGNYLAESNAILWYLADGTEFLPTNKLERAQVLQWLFFEQYSHEPNIATSRYWILILKQEEKYREQLQQKKIAGYEALAVMEKHLSKNHFFVGNKYSIADIGLYAYTHVADEGGFDLSGYPSVQAWLKRIAAQPQHIKITD